MCVSRSLSLRVVLEMKSSEQRKGRETSEIKIEMETVFDGKIQLARQAARGACSVPLYCQSNFEMSQPGLFIWTNYDSTGSEGGIMFRPACQPTRFCCHFL